MNEPLPGTLGDTTAGWSKEGFEAHREKYIAGLEARLRELESENARLHDVIAACDVQMARDTDDVLRESARVAVLEEALRDVAPFEVVTADAQLHHSPGDRMRLNSTETWLVSQRFKSKMRANQAAERLNALAGVAPGDHPK